MVVVVFRSRVRPDAGPGYEETGARMAALVATMPGFISYLPCTSADGEEVAIAEFEPHEAVAAWRARPEHREAQRLGRERWYSEYRITDCETVRDYSFKARNTA